MGSLEILFLTYYNHPNISINCEMKVLVVYLLGLATLASAGRWRHGHSGLSKYRNTGYQPQSQRAPLLTIAGAALGNNGLSTLFTAVKAAGLVHTLNGQGTFTVFAPKNAAFDALPAGVLANLLKPENVDQLKEILLTHVVGSVIKAEDIPEGVTDVKTVGGETITVTKSANGVTVETPVGKANIVATNVFASNGVIHVIDTVLQPASDQRNAAATKLPTIAEAAIATPAFSTLVTAVKAAGLVPTLNGAGTFTVFVPTNSAFAKIPAKALGDLLKPENVDQLKAILLTHVVGSVIKAEDIPEGVTDVKTVGGETIRVTKSANGVTVETPAGQANILATNVLASNGVVHVIDTVLQPASDQRNAAATKLPTIA